ncbi:hypothetical protein GQ457_05G035860 [Hibiscus cannabinus]
MGKVGDKPRTSERKCRRKRRKQRTSRKKGPCDRVNAPKAKERVHDVAKNINEDGSVPRVPDFAVVEVPTRVNATEGKLLAEVLGTYFLIFAGCASVVVNVNNDKVVSLPGISMVWGLAVTVPFYMVAQVVGSTMAAGTLRLLFSGPHDVFAGTSPQGSDLQAFVIEFIITFYLMFVVSGVATDDRAIGEFAGLAVGSIVLLNLLFAGPITGASMNPARSLGPAIVWNRYKGIWIYLTSVVGAVSGAWVYNMLRFTDKPLPDITKVTTSSNDPKTKESHMYLSVPFMQKLLTEVLGTYFLIFAGCAAVVVNANNDDVVSHPGIATVWGLAVIVLFYSSAHVSGAHFNPAITIAFATCKRFPLEQASVPFFILAQVVGSTLAAGTLRLLFSGPHDVFAGTSPQGSDLQAFVIEFIITFYLMFIISGAATDNRAIRELAGLAIGSTVLLNADNRSIDEPGKEFGTGNRVEPLQRNMDISYITDRRGRVGCLGV